MKSNWTVSRDKKFSKYLKNCPTEKDNFYTELEVLINSDNPRNSAEFVLTKKFGRCWVRRITKSYRLAYDVSLDKNELTLYAIGDHKLIYGHD